MTATSCAPSTRTPEGPGRPSAASVPRTQNACSTTWIPPPTRPLDPAHGPSASMQARDRRDRPASTIRYRTCPCDPTGHHPKPGRRGRPEVPGATNGPPTSHRCRHATTEVSGQAAGFVRRPHAKVMHGGRSSEPRRPSKLGDLHAQCVTVQPRRHLTLGNRADVSPTSVTCDGSLDLQPASIHHGTASPRCTYAVASLPPLRTFGSRSATSSRRVTPPPWDFATPPRTPGVMTALGFDTAIPAVRSW